MKADRRKELINRCRGFAKKNSFCLTLAAAYIFCVIVIENIYSHFKKAIIIIMAALSAAIILVCIIHAYRKSELSQGNALFTSVISQDDKSGDPKETLADVAKRRAVTPVVTPTAVPSATEAQNWELTAVDDVKTDNTDGILLLNKFNAIPDSYVYELSSIGEDLQCDVRAAEPVKQMLSDASKEGIELVINSAYRTGDRQKELFDAKLKKYMMYGYSYLEAYKKTCMENAIPGHSEHEVGLAFDIVSSDHDDLDEAFGDTDAGRWLADNSYKYGLILRYPKDKEDVTGIIYEPWHFRYVGEEAAEKIYVRKITLEEYMEGN